MQMVCRQKTIRIKLHRRIDNPRPKLSGTFDVIVAGASIGIPFEYEDTLPIMQRPEIDIEGMRLGDLSLSGASLLLDAKLKNPNEFPIGISGPLPRRAKR